MAARLTPLSCKKIEKKLLKLGFILDDVDGSKRFFKKKENGHDFVVQVHFHPGDKSVEIISGILRNGNISRNDWIRA